MGCDFSGVGQERPPSETPLAGPCRGVGGWEFTGWGRRGLKEGRLWVRRAPAKAQGWESGAHIRRWRLELSRPDCCPSPALHPSGICPWVLLQTAVTPGVGHWAPGINTHEVSSADMNGKRQVIPIVLAPQDRMTLSGVSSHFPEVPEWLGPRLLGMVPAKWAITSQRCHLDPNPFLRVCFLRNQPKTSIYVKADQVNSRILLSTVLAVWLVLIIPEHFIHRHYWARGIFKEVDKIVPHRTS